MFERFSKLARAAVFAEADVARQRRHVTHKCVQAILSAERLADRVEPERVMLRRMGVVTVLPRDFLPPVQEVLDMAREMRDYIVETPMEDGLLIGPLRDP